MATKNRMSKINWRFAIPFAVSLNVASIMDGNFFDLKLNAAILLMVIIAMYIYE